MNFGGNPCFGNFPVLISIQFFEVTMFMSLSPWFVEEFVCIWVLPKMVGFPPKSSILIGISIINHPFWGPPTFGNTHMIGTLLPVLSRYRYSPPTVSGTSLFLGHPSDAHKYGDLCELLVQANPYNQTRGPLLVKFDTEGVTDEAEKREVIEFWEATPCKDASIELVT